MDTAVSKQASKYVRYFSKKKRNPDIRTQVSQPNTRWNKDLVQKRYWQKGDMEEKYALDWLEDIYQIYMPTLEENNQNWKLGYSHGCFCNEIITILKTE